MSKIIQQIITFLFLILALMTSAQTNNTPDFAYPKQVADNAQKNITTSLNTGNGKALVKSLVEYSIAQSLIDADNLPETIERIEEITAKEKDPCIKAILNILLLDIYDGIYNYNRWKYDKRDNPLLPLPKDYNTWDGNQFKHKILELCDSALSNPASLQASSLREYASIITHNSLTFQFYPTLYDFIARHIIEKISKYGDSANTLPITWLCGYSLFVNLRFTYASPITKRILSIYQNLLELNADRHAALIDCDIARISFLKNNVYNSNSKTVFELLQELYQNYKDSEYSAEILISMYDHTQDVQQKKWLYSKIKYSLEKYPNYTRHNCLENLINEIAQPSVKISFPDAILPNDSLNISIESNNAQNFKIDIYYIPDNTPKIRSRYSFGESSVQAQLINSIDLKCDSTIPFQERSQIKTSFDKPGYYILVPNINGEEIAKDKSYDVIRCSNMTLMKSEYSNENWVTVVNSKTGEPLSNIDIFNIINNQLISKVAVTDADGNTKITTDDSYFVATSGNNLSNEEYLYKSHTQYNSPHISGKCFTDLAIYHPGDSLKFSAVIYQTENNKHKLYTNKTISIKLYNPNNQEIDTISLRTDEWGRISHDFKLPTDGLTGTWDISIYHDYYITSTRFTVSDYKLPTYFVEVAEVIRNSPETGAVTLIGKAETYSGFPLADIDINLNLSVSTRSLWWRATSPHSFYTTKATTDADGKFSIVLPAELLESSPIPNGIFSAKITATSANGESQETDKTFTLGETYNILASLNDNIEVSNPIKLDFKLTDINDKTIYDTINYFIKKDEKIVHQGEFHSTQPIIDLKSVPSGCYSFTFTLADSTIAQPYTINNICLYRNSDKMPPIDTALWIPTTRYTINNKSQKANILYGTTAHNSHIEYYIWNENRLYSKGWLTPTPGLHHLEVELPDSTTNLTVSFRSCHEYQCMTGQVEIKLKNSTPSIVLKAESFRNKITPGTKETWKFRVTDNTGNGSKSALIFDMYTKALDKVKNASSLWHFATPTIRGNSLDLYSPHYYDSSNWASITLNNSKNCPQLVIPQLYTYGYRIFNPRGSSISFLSRLKNRQNITADDIDYEESDSAPGYLAEPARFKAETYLNEVVQDGSPASNEFSYRAAEEPLAFFEPMLVTDDDGRLSFQFTVPNANTTWAFNAIAYNRELLTSNLSFDVVANKPIMVQPNKPRFLRSGDIVEIQASVMNNSDSVQSVNTIVEIFDYTTNETIQCYNYNNTIEPAQSAVVSTSITAPHNSPFIGYRIKSSTPEFADGEQSLIPVLPSTSPVIETKPFYIAPDSTSFQMGLPYIPDNARVTLQYCENPVWYCVTALPGMRTEESRSSLSAMAAIFSAAIAEGIIRNNPEIALAFKQWQQSDRSDSTLTSMLERNQDLKTILLNSTPWVMDARSDTERMTRIMLLFDKNEIEQVYTQNIKLLEKLQHSKGGWRWIAESNEPSEWCTMNILEAYSDLKRLGFLPKDKSLNEMITNAIKYIDDINARQYAKHPSWDYTRYVIIRDQYPEIKQSTAASRVTAATIQRLISQWREENVAIKAIDAMILDNHNYHSTALQILNSIREYSRSEAATGMWWPSLENISFWSMGKVGATSIILDAFNQIEPSCSDIDKIRQWLILQKEATDWGSSAITSQVITSILYSGTKWHHSAQGSFVKIGSQTVSPTKFESITGYFREDVSNLHPSEATLAIIKPAKTPSWGAIYSQYTQENREINAASCDAVSIDKRIYRQASTPDGVKWEYTNDLKVGDKAKIELVIKTTRDMEYVAIIDNRAACFEPVEQLPTPIITEGIYFYRENRDAATNMFVNRLPKGTYLLSYEVYVNNSGTFSSGIASIQSQYAPELSAHSAGTTLSSTD